MRVSKCSNSVDVFSIRSVALCICFIFAGTKALDLFGPVTTKALINGTVTLRCRISLKGSFEKVKVQWLKDGFGYENETLRDYFNGRYKMPGAKESGIYDLVIHSLENQDDGEYACQVNADVGNKQNSNILKTTKSINLTVIVPPKRLIIGSLSNEEDVNNTLKYVDNEIHVIWGKIKGFIDINCNVIKARPAAKLQWSLGKSEIMEGKLGDIDGDEIGSLTTRSESIHSNENDQFYFKTESKLKLRLRRDHNGELLKCSVLNTEDFLNQIPESRNVLINVLYITDVKLDITPNRPYYQFTEQETLSINCSASTNPAMVIYNWIKYDPQTGRFYVIKVADEHGLLKIKINRDLNKMFIRCQVLVTIKNHECKQTLEPGTEISETSFFNNCSMSHLEVGSNQIPLRVRYSPVIFDSVLETKSAFLGDVVTIECNADSNPPSKISWYKSSVSLKEIMSNPEIRSHEFYKDFSDKSHSLLSLISFSSRHQFTVTDADKLGLFICIARANGFSPAQKVVFVGQGATPQIINNHRLIVATLGSSVRIPCHIFSIPLPNKSDIMWFKNSKLKVLKPKLKDKIYEEDRLAGLVSYLYIHRVSIGDYGIYNCSVINLYGHASDVIELIPPAETPLIFIIGSSCAVILAIIFAFIIFCIVRTSKVRSIVNSRGPIYSKGRILSSCNSPINHENLDTGFTNSYIDGVGDFRHEDFFQMQTKNVFDPPCLNAPQSILNNVSVVHFDSNHLKHCQSSPKEQNFDLNIASEMDHQTMSRVYSRRSEWIECQNAQTEAANESTRSYDSGVCPDESNLTSCSSQQAMYSASLGLGPYQVYPFYQQSKGILESPHFNNKLCHPSLCNLSNNLLSSIELSSQCCTNTFNRSEMSDKVFSRINLDHENDPAQNYSSGSKDIKSANDSIIPYIIAYSPSNLSVKKLNWTTKDQTTKL